MYVEANVEDSSHCLLHCPIYFVPRQKVLQNLHSVIDVHDLNVGKLLPGSDNYYFKTNCDIFQAVHQFILESDSL